MKESEKTPSERSKEKKCTASFTKCVCVELKGEPHPSGFPYMPDDGGLINEFLRWSLDNKIFTIVRAGSAGGGTYMGFYSEEDAEKIREWLKEKVNNEI
jgi:hypothetical protein